MNSMFKRKNEKKKKNGIDKITINNSTKIKN